MINTSFYNLNPNKNLLKWKETIENNDFLSFLGFSSVYFYILML